MCDYFIVRVVRNITRVKSCNTLDYQCNANTELTEQPQGAVLQRAAGVQC